MPGILPMKVIKVGSATSQLRIAQACDRCRSKKIRCDGLAPTCSQCSNVGFECKTSDKLSRRAFPRGYTESLEDRVRQLELENRELKDLLDEKDEKIEMLSKFHSRTPSAIRKSSMTPPADNDQPKRPTLTSPQEETFKILQSPFLEGYGDDAHFIGASSGRALVDAFKEKLQSAGSTYGAFNPASFFPAYERSRSWLVTGSQPCDASVAPPRLLSDQLINVFFQEWAPLFPILHRPTFLSQYEEYVSNTSNITDRRVLTQLNLVFGIAALSQTGQLKSSIEQYEKRWSAALEGCYLETSLASLQCLILAQVHAMLSASPMKLLHFRSRAVGMSQRLGLHLSQKRFTLGTLTTETRKRIFWTLYTLDCFAAATFGLPRALNEADVECEYPVDADDEYVTEEGFMPPVPGACTKLSSALALFRCSRVLAKVLEEHYPASASYDSSLSKTAALDAELEAWQETLAPHLRMEFLQDKPSTNIISSRSPLLSLTYHYIRTLIHRPAACGPLGKKASASVVALASSSKRIVQLVQLLDERNLNFSHCMNKDELLIVSGFGLLFQAMDLEKDGKFLRDVSRMVYTVADLLENRHAPSAAEFRAISASILPITEVSSAPVGHSSPPIVHAVVAKDVAAHMQTQRQLQALAAKTSNTKKPLPKLPEGAATTKQRSSYSTETDRTKQFNKSITPAITVSSPRRISQPVAPRPSTGIKATLKQALHHISPPPPATNPNLDYLPLAHALPPRKGPAPPSTPTPSKIDAKQDLAIWDNLLETYNGVPIDAHLPHTSYYSDPSMNNVYPVQGSYLQVPNSSGYEHQAYTPDVWAYSMHMHDHSHNNNHTHTHPQSHAQSHEYEYAQEYRNSNVNGQADISSLGFCEESLTGGEDFSSIDASSNDSDAALNGFMLPLLPHGLNTQHTHQQQHDQFNQLDPVELQKLQMDMQYWQV